MTLLGLAYFNAGWIYDYEDTLRPDHLAEVDAIVCLAGGRGRIKEAATLWQKYALRFSNPPYLFLSGMGQKTDWDAVKVLIGLDLAQKINQEMVIVERESQSTLENAKFFEFEARKRNWKNIVLVTSSYHMKRAVLIFNRELEGIHIETHSHRQEPFLPKMWRHSLLGVQVSMNEYLKWLFYDKTMP